MTSMAANIRDSGEPQTLQFCGWEDGAPVTLCINLVKLSTGVGY